VIECPSPEDIPNAKLLTTLNNYVINTTIQYECDSGFQVASGDLSRRCVTNGAWSGVALHCRGNFCFDAMGTFGHRRLCRYRRNLSIQLRSHVNFTLKRIVLSGPLMQCSHHALAMRGSLLFAWLRPIYTKGDVDFRCIFKNRRNDGHFETCYFYHLL
jgi:hypothetical protein